MISHQPSEDGYVKSAASAQFEKQSSNGIITACATADSRCIICMEPLLVLSGVPFLTHSFLSGYTTTRMWVLGFATLLANAIAQFLWRRVGSTREIAQR